MTAAAQPQNTAVAKIEPKAQGVVADVQKMEKQFALALPEHVSPEKYVRVVATAINSNPDLQKADRQSVLEAAMKCAQDGLLPDGREAALVVYNTKVKNDGGRDEWVKKAQYLPMIQGVLTKVRRSGELKTISAHVVYANDVFTYVLGDEEHIEHKPRLDGPRGKAIAVYAIAKTKDGGIYREVMSIEQVNQVRAVSRAKDRGPWVDWWDEMARKSVLRRLAKRLPMSTDLVQLFQRDDDHYDLSRAAQGAATMRRLHADFEEPSDGAVAVDATVVPDEPAEAAEAATDAPEGAQGQSKADEVFPGDQHLIEWADDVLAGLSEDRWDSVQALDEFCNDDENSAKFGRLEEAAPAKASSLNAAIRGKRKALADRERS